MGLFFKNKTITPSVIDEVKEFIANDLFISKIVYHRSEGAVEDKLVEQLTERFANYPVRRQCKVGDKFHLKCDVDIANKACGIELKLARSLESKADEFQRAIGQVACYVHEEYTETGLILLVIGEDEEMSDKVKELKRLVEYYPRVHFVYKLAQYRR